MTRPTRALAALFIATATLVLAVPAGAGAPAGPTSSIEAKGRDLSNRFLELLEAKDAAGLRRFLSPAFQLQRADGSYANKVEYLRAPAIVESHEIDNLRVTRDGDVMVVRFDLVVDATIDGQPQSTEPAPRLATFRKGAHGWQLVSYANFNVPAAEPQP
jgi:ketosteroid isomerase-like protein